ncbi:MAG: hypothetical protein BWY66_02598 [bacterium ADurb.Bin374]|nr:MAG: hypothetical protein BWY66_02598 [bacterium ADurb.Bin374]
MRILLEFEDVQISGRGNHRAEIEIDIFPARYDADVVVVDVLDETRLFGIPFLLEHRRGFDAAQRALFEHLVLADDRHHAFPDESENHLGHRDVRIEVVIERVSDRVADDQAGVAIHLEHGAREDEGDASPVALLACARSIVEELDLAVHRRRVVEAADVVVDSRAENRKMRFRLERIGDFQKVRALLDDVGGAVLECDRDLVFLRVFIGVHGISLLMIYA